MEACYRHPNRETGVRCSNCERPICPDCMTTTPVGMRCPECANQTHPRPHDQERLGDEPILTYILIGINVAVALGALLGGASATGGGIGGSTLLQDGSVSRPEIADGEYWRLVTAGFLHAGFFHLLFNMFSLYILGGLLEPAVGRLRFGLDLHGVAAGGLVRRAAAGAHVAARSGPPAPSSGSWRATAVVMRNRGMSIMESGLGIWIVLNLVITFSVPNISIGGHLGGLVGGGLAAFLMFELGDRARLPEWVLAMACAGVSAAAVAGAIAVSSSGSTI